MQDLIIQPDNSSPAIHFDAGKHLLQITGESYPENTVLFYEPVFLWLQTYLDKSRDEDILLEIELVYFNSSSSKVLSDLFELLSQCVHQQSSITVHWRYHRENDMSLEYGEEFQDEFDDLNFKLIEFGDD